MFSRTSHTSRRKHAVVLGASMGGLAAARALSDHFEHVTVLDRDQLPHEAQQRRGVPHGQHAHGILAGGLAALEQLFPGIEDELIARGAIAVQVGRELAFYNEGERLAESDVELATLLLSRPLLEGHVRERVRRLPNVTVHERCEALSLVGSAAAISGVRVQWRGAAKEEKVLAADLVVDASGRSSRLPDWLEQLGVPRAPEETVQIGLGYVSCTYRRKPGHGEGFQGLISAVAPPNPRSGVVLAQESDHWIVTLSGYFHQQAQPTHEGMREFARGLPSSALYEFLCSAEPLSEPVSMRFPYSRRRHYEQLRVFPEGLLAVGDALCSFNPSFGQGMSVAALEALQLRECLQQGTSSLWRRMFERSAKIIDTPWTIAVGADLEFPEVEGKRTALGRVLGRYVRHLRRGAVHDPKLSAAFFRVAQLVDEPSALLRPEIVWRVLHSMLGVREFDVLQPRQRESLVG